MIPLLDDVEQLADGLCRLLPPGCEVEHLVRPAATDAERTPGAREREVDFTVAHPVSLSERDLQ